ncbi:hypothetical protein T484DRAFT_1777841, partial [Baffinella frigidus]
EAGIKNATELAFLEGYYDATLAILHENARTWVGRVAVLNHTATITTLSLNISQRRQPVIWSANRLPHNIKCLVPVPAPAGGVLAVSSNAILYRNHGVRCALKLSEYATVAGDGGLRYDGTGKDALNMDAPPPVLLDGYQFLFSVVDGRTLVATLRLDEDGDAVRGIEITQIPVKKNKTVSYIYFGSRLGDSALLRISKTPRLPAGSAPAPAPPKAVGGFVTGGFVGGGVLAGSGGVSSVPAAAATGGAGGAGEDDDGSDDDLYGGGAGQEKPAATPKAAKVDER